MSTPVSTRLSTSRLLKAGGAAVLAAVSANVIARLLLGALVSLSPSFQPFTLGAIITFTVMFTAVGVAVLAVINRLAATPLRTYNIIAVAAFVLSILPNLAGGANPTAMPMGGSGADYLILILFHVVAAAGFLGALNYVARKA